MSKDVSANRPAADDGSEGVAEPLGLAFADGDESEFDPSGLGSDLDDGTGTVGGTFADAF